MQLTNKNIAINVIYEWCISEKQKMCMFVDLLTFILASLFAALMFTGIHNQFPLLTMSYR